MDSIHVRRKHYEQQLAVALRQLNDAICNVHKSGLDVAVSTVIMHTQRGPMVQVDLHTFRLEGAPPILKIATDETLQF